MSTSIDRWQLVHFSARASGLLVSYRPVFFSRASWVFRATRCFCVQPAVACGSRHFSLGPWQPAQVTPSSTLYPSPWRFSGTETAWQLRHRSSSAAAFFRPSFLAMWVAALFVSDSDSAQVWWSPSGAGIAQAVCSAEVGLSSAPPAAGTSAPWHLAFEQVDA